MPSLFIWWWRRRESNHASWTWKFANLLDPLAKKLAGQTILLQKTFPHGPCGAGENSALQGSGKTLLAERNCV